MRILTTQELMGLFFETIYEILLSPIRLLIYYLLFSEYRVGVH